MDPAGAGIVGRGYLLARRGPEPTQRALLFLNFCLNRGFIESGTRLLVMYGGKGKGRGKHREGGSRKDQ
eukprot:1353319-Amorphochlora_amoeboformis.AAC.3